MKPEDDKPRNKGGRPKGSMSKIAEEARVAAKATGLLPHEILLSMARGEAQQRAVINDKGEQVGIKWEVPDLEQSKDAAKSAAPYYAPKISTVEVVHGVSDDDLDAIIASAAAEAGISLGPGGEGEESEGGEPEGGSPTPTGGGLRRVRLRD